MTDKRISQLTELLAIDTANSDLMPIVDISENETKKITVEEAKDLFHTTVNWGDVEGTLSAQTDLQTALDEKLDVSALSANINLYPTNVVSDIEGYFKLVSDLSDPDYNDPAVNISTGAITTTAQLLASLVSYSSIVVGDLGVLNITTIGNIRRVSGTGTASFYFELYHRTDGGVETLIATSSDTVPVETSGYTQFYASAMLNNGPFIDTDRIVLKFYADRISGGVDPVYEFQFGGDIPVRTLLPVPVSVIPTGDIPATNVIYAGNEPLEDLLDETINKGILNPIIVTDDGGLNISWSAGEIFDHATKSVVETIAGSGTCSTDTLNFLKWVSGTGLTLNTVFPSGDEIIVAGIACQSNDIIEVIMAPVLDERETNIADAITRIFPSIVTSGLIVSADTDVTNVWDVKLSTGEYLLFGQKLHTIASTIYSRITPLVRWYKTAGVWVSDNNNAQILYNQWNNGTNLVAVNTNKYYRHNFTIVDSQIHFIVADAEYSSLADAIAAQCPTRPPGLSTFPRSTCVILKGSATAFPTAGGIQWIDVRPTVGITNAGAITDHQALNNREDVLAHSQYQLDVITTEGDMVQGGTSGVEERLAIGASGSFPISNGTRLAYSNSPTLKNYIETYYNIGSVTGAQTINLANGPIQEITASASTLTISMPSVTGTAGKSFTLILNPSTFTIAWGSVFWLGTTGSTTSPTITASKKHVLTFFSNGTSWHGSLVGKQG